MTVELNGQRFKIVIQNDPNDRYPWWVRIYGPEAQVSFVQENVSRRKLADEIKKAVIELALFSPLPVTVDELEVTL